MIVSNQDNPALEWWFSPQRYLHYAANRKNLFPCIITESGALRISKGLQEENPIVESNIDVSNQRFQCILVVPGADRYFLRSVAPLMDMLSYQKRVFNIRDSQFQFTVYCMNANSK
ncbi:MAG: hypothetical protein AB1656_22800 [Candidatus Omnitrophota bacterium]